MRPRWQIALLVLTMPLWIIPGCIWVGWREAGRHTVCEIPAAVRAILGRQP